MLSIRLSLNVIVLFLLIIALPNSVSAFPKYKVAVLPIMNTANLQTREISDLIQYKIHRKLRYPFYEFIPDTEITSAIKAFTIANSYIIPNKKNLSSLSQTLSADIVLVVEIVTARADLQKPVSFFSDKTIENTDVLLKCYAYSASDNNYYLIKAEKYDSALLSVNSGLLYATDPIIDELLKKLPFETIPVSTSLN